MTDAHEEGLYVAIAKALTEVTLSSQPQVVVFAKAATQSNLIFG
jgi:hypothetical protein